MSTILWHSNSMQAPTGYGNQTALFAPLINSQDDTTCVVSAFYGREGAAARDAKTGVIELPRYQDSYGNDIINAHYQSTQSDAVVSLIDPFVLNPDAWRTLNWAAWVPVDSAPLSRENKAPLQHATRIWAMSRFGQDQLREAGFTNVDYVPHGIDTDTYAPLPDRGGARRELEAFTGADIGDKFLVVTVAANKGQPSRKNFQGMMQAFTQFHRRNPDTIWYIHTEKAGHINGEDLEAMAEYHGIQDSVVFPRQYEYITNQIAPSFLNKVYNAADVFILLSLGEGFGIPIVEAQAAGCPVLVTDSTAMTELVFAGRTVGGREIMAWGARTACRWKLADVSHAVSLLRTMYDSTKRDDYQQVRDAARQGALQYDYRRVFNEYMRPALDKLTRRANSGDKYRQLGPGYHWQWAHVNPDGHYAQWTKRVLRELPEHGNGATVLDYGCGDGWPASQLVSRGYDVTGVDIYDDVLSVARQRVPEATFTTSIPAATFDYVVMLDVLEHIERDADMQALVKAVQSCRRYALLSVPVPGVDAHAVRDYTDSDIKGLFAGCDVAILDRTPHSRLIEVVPRADGSNS